MIPPMKFRMAWGLLLFSISIPLVAQTDEAIFRDFRFDFSTPGARANGMGRTFVGLSDEATAAYNNPAGLAVLNKPEFSFEFRSTTQNYPTPRERDPFTFSTPFQEQQVDTDQFTFASYSGSIGETNLSVFYVNHLDYHRPRTDDSITFLFEPNNAPYIVPTLPGLEPIDFDIAFLSDDEVRRIKLDTYGFSLSKRFGNLSLGLTLGMAELEVDYRYRTNLNTLDYDFLIIDQLRSSAVADSLKLTFGLGTLYQATDRLKIGASLKIQPGFTYLEQAAQQIGNSDLTPIPVRLKVPDSYQLGGSYQLNDFWLIAAEIDWVQHRQLVGDNLTLLSVTTIDGEPFAFETSDYKRGNDPELHVGTEYLLPKGRHIFAFRTGFFTDPDNATRFVGNPEGDENPVLFDTQDLIYNAGSRSTELGYTFGLGYVFNNKIQFDIAYVKSERFDWAVSSLLYRF
jgi:hypothetical protein